jgi:hypothetical protein
VPSLASNGQRVLAERGFVMPQPPMNAPRRVPASSVYYRGVSRAHALAIGEVAFGRIPFEARPWRTAESDLRRSAGEADVAVVIGKDASHFL